MEQTRPMMIQMGLPTGQLLTWQAPAFHNTQLNKNPAPVGRVWDSSVLRRCLRTWCFPWEEQGLLVHKAYRPIAVDFIYRHHLRHKGFCDGLFGQQGTLGPGRQAGNHVIPSRALLVDCDVSAPRRFLEYYGWIFSLCRRIKIGEGIVYFTYLFSNSLPS